jgi:ubiquinone/menaquinone biosynthesis C-methylase UbiE
MLNMTLEEAYYRGSRLLGLWVRLVKAGTRKMQLKDSSSRNSNSLLISPPTDFGIRLVSEAGQTAEAYLLCFSDRTAQIATKYCEKHRCEAIRVKVAPFFSIPFGDSYFSSVYMNCFFDFCPGNVFDPILDEVGRVLRAGGSLFTVNMAGTPTANARMWLWILRRLSFCRGLHPVDIASRISQRGFRILRDQTVKKLSFPMQYTHAEKTYAIV